MKKSKIIFFATFLTCLFAFVDNVNASECSIRFTDGAQLFLKSCNKKDAVEQAVFVDEIKKSPYATIFDNRNIMVVKSVKSDYFLKSVGFNKVNGKIIFNNTTLEVIPEKEKIYSRKPERTVKRIKKWIVGYENIQYQAQGIDGGFPLICATAIFESDTLSTAISECFSLENKTRFIKTLSYSVP